MMRSHLAAAALALLAPSGALAFGGIPSSGQCTDFDADPQDFARHRDDDITYRLTNNFKSWYPDDFSQYLVKDVVELWEFYIGGVSPWNADIADRFSYYRSDPNTPVYELKSVLTHEFGHALGMQHSDACWYNLSNVDNQPLNLNFRTSGSVFTAQATLGPETMNEYARASSPGAKAGPPVDGYFRTPGRDDLEFMGMAYPFLSIDFVEIQNGTPRISLDSTNVNNDGGQTSYPGGFTNIVAGDADQGRYFDGVNIWIGNNIGIKSRSEGWFVENFTGFDIVQITLRVDGTSTRRAIDESAPPFFTSFGFNLTDSAEQMIFGWTTPFAGPWPPGASGYLTLDLDVHDWTVSEALIWANSNQAFPMALAFYGAQTPWGFASPGAPPPGQGPQFLADPSLPPEITPVPDAIELIPPRTESPGATRGFTATLPSPDGARIESFEILPIEWAEAELLLRTPPAQRSPLLAEAFSDRRGAVRDLLFRRGGDSGLAPAAAGFSGDGRRAVSRFINVDLPDTKTYAARLVASNGRTRVTSLALPEHNAYYGAQLARCDNGNSAEYCCPSEMTRHPATVQTGRLRQPSCIAGGPGADDVAIVGAHPHFLTLGGGADRVRAHRAGSVVLLGPGNDEFEAQPNAAATVRAARGDDLARGSKRSDHIDAGEGADRVFADGGDDILILGEGADRAEAGPGDDLIYPGGGGGSVDAGPGNDTVVFTDSCETVGAVSGGTGVDRLVLPATRADAERAGLRIDGFERIVEGAARASRFADC